MNKIQSNFSLKRLALLVKREAIMKRSFLLVATAGVLITITAVTILVLMNGRTYLHWDDDSQYRFFAIMFSIFGIIFSGTAFPAFRNSKKTMDFLLVPNSTTEKYLYEVIFRIVLYILIFPVLFWIGVNLAGAIFNSVSEIHYDLNYNLFTPFTMIHEKIEIAESRVSIYTIVLFLISIPFAGASYFSKIPLLKTAIFLAVLVAAFAGYGWILDKIFDFTHTKGVDFDVSEKTIANCITAFFVFSTLILHASAFFRLKEKEV